MLNISKALSSGQAQTYHKLEFTAETANYYKQDGAAMGSGKVSSPKKWASKARSPRKSSLV